VTSIGESIHGASVSFPCISLKELQKEKIRLIERFVVAKIHPSPFFIQIAGCFFYNGCFLSSKQPWILLKKTFVTLDQPDDWGNWSKWVYCLSCLPPCNHAMRRFLHCC
jgi:hypothetical protein